MVFLPLRWLSHRLANGVVVSTSLLACGDVASFGGIAMEKDVVDAD